MLRAPHRQFPFLHHLRLEDALHALVDGLPSPRALGIAQKGELRFAGNHAITESLRGIELYADGAYWAVAKTTLRENVTCVLEGCEYGVTEEKSPTRRNVAPPRIA